MEQRTQVRPRPCPPSTNQVVEIPSRKTAATKYNRQAGNGKKKYSRRGRRQGARLSGAGGEGQRAGCADTRKKANRREGGGGGRRAKQVKIQQVGVNGTSGATTASMPCPTVCPQLRMHLQIHTDPKKQNVIFTEKRLQPSKRPHASASRQPTVHAASTILSITIVFLSHPKIVRSQPRHFIFSTAGRRGNEQRVPTTAGKTGGRGGADKACCHGVVGGRGGG